MGSKTQKLIPLIGGINGIKNRVFDPLIGGGIKGSIYTPPKGGMIPDPYTHLHGGTQTGQRPDGCSVRTSPYEPHCVTRSATQCTVRRGPLSSAQAKRNKNKKETLDMKQFVHEVKQPLLYIAGPYSGRDAWARHLNIAAAEQLAMKATEAGFAVHCPHATYRHAYGWLHESVFIRADITAMLRCDALLVVPGWEDSTYTKYEIAIAGKERIPAFFTLADAVIHFADRLDVVAA